MAKQEKKILKGDALHDGKIYKKGSVAPKELEKVFAEAGLFDVQEVDSSELPEQQEGEEKAE